MRQSRKEAELQRLARDGLGADRREAAAEIGSAHAEFAGDGIGGAPADPRNGRRHHPGGRG